MKTIYNLSNNINKIKKNKRYERQLIKTDKIPIKIEVEPDINIFTDLEIEKYDFKLVKNFGKCYSEIISKICNYFIHHDDILRDYRDTGCETIFKRDMDIIIKYSPIKIKNYSYIEYANIYLEIPEIYEISNITMKYINKEIKKINNLLLDDYKEVLMETKNKWFYHIPKERINEMSILQIIEQPFHKINKHKWTLKYKLLSTENLKWYPLKVINYSNDPNKSLYYQYINSDTLYYIQNYGY